MSHQGDGADPAANLRARSLRATPQRRAILAAFEGGSAEHLSAEEIHARASARVEGLGRGTVYATLADLAEVGLLAAVGDQEPIRYESNTDPHVLPAVPPPYRRRDQGAVRRGAHRGGVSRRRRHDRRRGGVPRLPGLW